MSVYTGRRVFRSSKWALATVAVAALVPAIGAWMTFRERGLSLLSVGLAAFAVLGVGGILETITLRVELSDDVLHVTRWWVRRSYPKESIARVRHEKGVDPAMKRKIGWALSLLVLLGTGATGLYDGVRGLPGAHTTFQYSVTIGVLLYGILGLAAGTATAVRHPSSVWLATLWGVVVTYVASTAALAYAGLDATLAGAVGGGLGAALIAAGVVWGARASVRRPAAREARDSVRTLAIIVAVLSVTLHLGACRSLYQSPPVVGPTDGVVTKRVRAKREPDRLIAEDLSVCWVIPEVFAGIKPGDHWRCDWRHIPPGM